MPTAKHKNKRSANRLLSLAASQMATRKAWTDALPEDLADEIRVAVDAIAGGRSDVSCAALSRAVIEDLKDRHKAGSYKGAIPSYSSVWQTLRPQIHRAGGGQ